MARMQIVFYLMEAIHIIKNIIFDMGQVLIRFVR